MIRASRINKLAFTFFIFLAAGSSFSGYAGSRSPSSLAGAVTLSLAFSLALLLAYLLQVLPSLSSGESYRLLSTLPLNEGDFSLVATLSVVRTFDYLVLGAVVTQTLLIFALTESAAAAALMLAASLMNSAFAIAIAVWLSGVFYRNITRGGRSRLGAISRLLFLITWGVGISSVLFSFNFISYLLPIINNIISRNLSQAGTAVILSAVHPFSAGLLISGIVYGSVGSLATLAPLLYAVLVGYLALAVVAGKKTLGVVSRIIHGENVGIARQAAKDFLLKIHSPLSAYTLKDLRVASKNPSSAFVFALPVLETLFVTLILFGHSLRASSIISATWLACFFTIVSASALLNTEGTGMDYSLSLPVSTKIMIRAKSLVATGVFLPVPVAIGVLLALGRPTSGLLFLIPLLEVLALSAATTVELSFFIRSYEKKLGLTGLRDSATYRPSGYVLLSGGGMFRLVGAVLAAIATAFAPLLAYAATYLLTANHAEALVAMAAIAVGEFILVQALLSRT